MTLQLLNNKRAQEAKLWGQGEGSSSSFYKNKVSRPFRLPSAHSQVQVMVEVPKGEAFAEVSSVAKSKAAADLHAARETKNGDSFTVENGVRSVPPTHHNVAAVDDANVCGATACCGWCICNTTVRRVRTAGNYQGKKCAGLAL